MVSSLLFSAIWIFELGEQRLRPVLPAFRHLEHDSRSCRLALNLLACAALDVPMFAGISQHLPRRGVLFGEPFPAGCLCFRIVKIGKFPSKLVVARKLMTQLIRPLLQLIASCLERRHRIPCALGLILVPQTNTN